jgi:hypothetical protein
MTDHFVPASVLRDLTRGSFEHLAHSVDTALAANSERFFGKGAAVRRLAVFEDRVIAASDDGRFLGIRYTKTADGITLNTATPLKLPVYSGSEIADYVKTEAISIANSFLKGDRAFARQQLAALVPFIGAGTQLTEEQRADSILVGLQADRSWKKLYRERKEAIDEFLGEKLAALNKADPATAFMDKPDLLKLGEELAGLHAAIAAQRRTDDIAEAVNAQGDSAALDTFVVFCDDLLADIQDSRKAVLEANNAIVAKDQLARVYNALSAEMFHYKIAAEFVSLMSEKLRESA